VAEAGKKGYVPKIATAADALVTVKMANANLKIA